MRPPLRCLPLLPDIDLIRRALTCTCPRCGKGALYRSGFTMTLNDRCDSCSLDLAKNDSGDGPAVFLIFILGFLLTMLALAVEAFFHPPLWVHAAVTGVVGLGAMMAALRPIKSYIIALQFKYRPETWGRD